MTTHLLPIAPECAGTDCLSNYWIAGAGATICTINKLYGYFVCINVLRTQIHPDTTITVDIVFQLPIRIALAFICLLTSRFAHGFSLSLDELSRSAGYSHLFVCSEHTSANYTPLPRFRNDCLRPSNWISYKGFLCLIFTCFLFLTAFLQKNIKYCTCRSMNFLHSTFIRSLIKVLADIHKTIEYV